MRLDGAVAMVTGGASGLGRAAAARLSSTGAQVVIIDLAGSGGAQQADAIGARFFPADVTNEAELRDAVGQAASLGQVRVVVACAGVSDVGRIVDRDGRAAPLDRFVRTMMINLAGTFNVIRLAAEHMIGNSPLDGDRGVVICTSSVAAFDGQIGQSAYAASKAGVAGMVLPLAREFAEHAIRVLAVAPGMFATPLLTGLPVAAQASLLEQAVHPRRLGEPSEFGDCVAFLVDNAMMNGETVRLDGGLRMAAR